MFESIVYDYTRAGLAGLEKLRKDLKDPKYKLSDEVMNHATGSVAKEIQMKFNYYDIDCDRDDIASSLLKRYRIELFLPEKNESTKSGIKI